MEWTYKGLKWSGSSMELRTLKTANSCVRYSIWSSFQSFFTVSLHTQAVKRCEFFTYELDTEDCNLYESDAEAGHLVEDPNFIHGPRICPTGDYEVWGCFKIWVSTSANLLSDNFGYQMAISPAVKALPDSDSPEECMVWLHISLRLHTRDRERFETLTAFSDQMEHPTHIEHKLHVHYSVFSGCVFCVQSLWICDVEGSQQVKSTPSLI